MSNSRIKSLACLLAVVAGSAALAPAAIAEPFDHFETGVAELSWIDTYLLAVASGEAYRGRVKDLEGETFAEKFRHSYQSLGLEVLAFIDKDDLETGAQALVLYNRKVLLVVFSGTEGHDPTAAMYDMLTDADIEPIEIDGVRLHRGFYQAHESVWEELREVVGRPALRKLEVWLTGHSMGAALANLTAYRMNEEGMTVGGVYTFAGPKIGDAEFVADFERRFGGRSQQWSTELDPITRIPELKDDAVYEKLGVTNVVYSSGKAELATTQKMSAPPNPLAHRVTAYANYIYRALPAEIRARVPNPPPLCAPEKPKVGLHPENGYPMCRESLLKIRRGACLDGGGEVVESWCLREDAGMFRYLARKLKG